MKFAIKLALAILMIIVIKLVWLNNAEAGGPWHDQYCDVETTEIRVVDQDGNVLESKVEEKVVCNDGASDFLEGMGIADNCEIFTWWMPLGETFIQQRDIACHRLDGGYEIVPGYHSIE